MYQLNPNEFDAAYQDAVTLPVKQWNSLLNFVFGIKLLNKQLDKEDDKVEEEEEKVPDTSAFKEFYDDSDEEMTDQRKVETRRMDDITKKRKYENLGIWVETNVYFKNFERIKF